MKKKPSFYVLARTPPWHNNFNTSLHSGEIDIGVETLTFRTWLLSNPHIIEIR